MQIQMLKTAAGPDGIFPAGTTRDVPEEEAQRLIAAGAAIELVTVGIPSNRQFGHNWYGIRELGAGGQGKVYLVEDQKYFGPLVDQLVDKLKSVSGVGDYKGARTLWELISRAKIDDYAHMGALKELHANKSSPEYKKALARMKSELQALREDLHPNIVKLYDEQIEKNGWFVMEFFPKGPLSNHRGKFAGNVELSLLRFRELVEAVGVLHAKGMVHRDIKPDNIYMRDNDTLVLGDFGLIWLNETDKTRISETYENVGSRDWMPGWAYGMQLEKVSPAFDVFSLAKVLWAMISGHTKMHLWYFKKDHYNLEKLFPDDSAMPIINELLAKCIVENESDCLQSANVLLAELDKTIQRIKGRNVSLAHNTKRECLVCGEGKYGLIVNGNSTDAHNFGISPTGMSGFKIYKCGFCGHIQMFHFENTEDPNELLAWRNDMPK